MGRVATREGARTRNRRAAWILLVAALAAASSVMWAVPPASAAGETRDPRVVGGTAVPDGKYRFIASIQHKSGLNGTYRGHFCGGTLIDKDSVLTAAHCVQDEVAVGLRVSVGTTVLTGGQGQVRNVARIQVHPRYDPNTVARDAAVLTLSNPVTGIAPVRLAASGQDSLETPGRYATVAGWGNTIKQGPDGSEPNSYPDRMREAQVPLVSDRSAERTYDAIYGPSGFIPPIQVAAGRTGKDACQGDSGGPLFASANRSYTQIGITSWGTGCGWSGYPGVYAEVNSPPVRGFIVNAAS